MDIALKYTICFIFLHNQVLMLNRLKKPNMGLWNGVGGKIEMGETPLMGIKREITEETGIILEDSKILSCGKVCWFNEGDPLNYGGMYLFRADLLSYDDRLLQQTDEGILCFKKVDWVLDDHNLGIVSNIRFFLPYVCDDQRQYQHNFRYRKIAEGGQSICYHEHLLQDL